MQLGQPSVDFLTARQEQLLAEYESKLRERRSGLLRYPETYEKCMAEAAEIIADLSGVLAAGDAALYQPPRTSGSYLRDLRPADLTDAARTLFEVLVAAAAEEPGIPLLEFSLGANTVISRRLSRDLSHHMLLAFDRIQREYTDERRRMARDLHDRIGGDIAAVHRNLDNCPVDDRSLASVREALRGVLDELRWVISGLRPARLPTGFAWALELYCHIECPAGVQAEVSVTGDDRWLDAQTRYEIFLIVREAMRNAFNHSGANRVTVDIDSSESGLTATVTDNGIGFQPKGGQGAGLTLMMDRAEVLGGMVRLEQPAGGRNHSGTRYTEARDLWMNAPISIAIADDHTLFREGVRRLLEREQDIEVQGEAGNGAEALELVAAAGPDVVLLDVKMPGDGVSMTVRRMKQIWPRTVVIILSMCDKRLPRPPPDRGGHRGLPGEERDGHRVGRRDPLGPLGRRADPGRLDRGIREHRDDDVLSRREREMLELAGAGPVERADRRPALRRRGHGRTPPAQRVPQARRGLQDRRGEQGQGRLDDLRGRGLRAGAGTPAGRDAQNALRAGTAQNARQRDRPDARRSGPERLPNVPTAGLPLEVRLTAPARPR